MTRRHDQANDEVDDASDRRQRIGSHAHRLTCLPVGSRRDLDRPWDTHRTSVPPRLLVSRSIRRRPPARSGHRAFPGVLARLRAELAVPPVGGPSFTPDAQAADPVEQSTEEIVRPRASRGERTAVPPGHPAIPRTRGSSVFGQREVLAGRVRVAGRCRFPQNRQRPGMYLLRRGPVRGSSKRRVWGVRRGVDVVEGICSSRFDTAAAGVGLRRLGLRCRLYSVQTTWVVWHRHAIDDHRGPSGRATSVAECDFISRGHPQPARFGDGRTERQREVSTSGPDLAPR